MVSFLLLSPKHSSYFPLPYSLELDSFLCLSIVYVHVSLLESSGSLSLGRININININIDIRYRSIDWLF